MKCPRCKIELNCPFESCSKSRQKTRPTNALTWITVGDLMVCPSCWFKAHADVWQDHDIKEEGEIFIPKEHAESVLEELEEIEKSGIHPIFPAKDQTLVEQAKKWGENKTFPVKAEIAAKYMEYAFSGFGKSEDGKQVASNVSGQKAMKIAAYMDLIFNGLSLLGPIGSHWIESQINAETQNFLNQNKKDNMDPKAEKTETETESSDQFKNPQVANPSWPSESKAKIKKLKEFQAEVDAITGEANSKICNKADDLFHGLIPLSTLLEITDKNEDRHYGLFVDYSIDSSMEILVVVRNGRGSRTFPIRQITRIMGQMFAPLRMPDEYEESKGDPEIVNPYPPKNEADEPEGKPASGKFEDFPYKG